MKSERLLAITMLLLEREQISAPKLAEMFEVSVRTIYRDIESLSQAGIPVVALPGSKGGIRIMENYKIDQRFFTSSDLISLLTSLNGIHKHMNNKQTTYTIEKLKSLIPKQLEQEVALKTDQLIIDLSPWIQNGQAGASIDLIQQALDNHTVLSIEYENRAGHYSMRTIEPYRMILKESSWYVQAFCLSKQEFRIFKLSRMKNIQQTDTPFEQRTPPAVSFERDSSGKTAFVTLLLEVDYSVKDQMTERFNDLEFTQQKNSDRYRVEFPYFIPDEFGYHMLLGFGTRCKCLAPDNIRNELVRRLKEMLTFYS
ncbi:helix-turn-helix transcriptional regulator [Enterococcus larvae]|uniref:helix-turn-helix transcriptional regulator n=1 Tax=Enterococcus larvae TaxID=2794352 RepID=UPI003F350528